MYCGYLAGTNQCVTMSSVTKHQPLCVLLLTAVWETVCTKNTDTPYAVWDSQAVAATQFFKKHSFAMHASTSLALAMLKLVPELSLCEGVSVLQTILVLDVRPVRLVSAFLCVCTVRSASDGDRRPFSFVTTVSDLGGVFHLRTDGRSIYDLSSDARSSSCTLAVLLPSTCSSCMLGVRPSIVFAASCPKSRLVRTLLVRICFCL